MKYISLIFILLYTISLFGADGKWTLQECMEYAVKNSPKRNIQDAQNAIYGQDYLEAIGRLLPSLGANTQMNMSFGRGLDPSTNMYINENAFSNNYNINSSLLLFDGLSSIMRVKMQKMNKLMGKKQLQEIEDQIAYDTMEAFFNVLYYREMVTLAEQQLEESTVNLKLARRKQELGIMSFPDVAEIEAKEAKDQYDLTYQKNLLKIGIILLKEKMNFPVDAEFDIADEVNHEIIAKTNDSAFDLFEQARSFLPEALAADFSLKAQKLNLRISKGSYFPSISVNAGYSTYFSPNLVGTNPELSVGNQLKGEQGYSVLFTLSFPLFNGFSTFTQTKKSRLQVEIERNRREETLRTIYSEIEQAVADMNGQAEEYYQAKKQSDAMLVAYKLNQRKYSEGLVSIIELHTSANNLFEAKAGALNAQLKYYLKRRLVDYYRGEPFIR